MISLGVEPPRDLDERADLVQVFAKTRQIRARIAVDAPGLNGLERVAEIPGVEPAGEDARNRSGAERTISALMDQSCTRPVAPIHSLSACVSRISRSAQLA